MVGAKRNWLSSSMPGIVGIVVLLASAGDAGAVAGWMTGFGVGEVAIGDYELEMESTMLDDSDTGGRIFGGYQISYFAATLGYVDLGALEASGPAFGGFTDRIEADGFDVQGLGLLPLGSRVHLFGSLGFIRWDQHVTYMDPSETYDGTASGWSLSYGGGVDVMVNKKGNWVVHVEWTRYQDIGDLDVTGHENDRDLIGVGAVYRFGL